MIVVESFIEISARNPAVQGGEAEPRAKHGQVANLAFFLNVEWNDSISKKKLTNHIGAILFY
jgi:hypothetical protein